MRLFPALVFLFATAFFLVGCGGNGESEADRMAEEHEGETPTATEAARAPETSVVPDTVTYTETKEGAPVQGYVAAPANVDSVLEVHGKDPASAQLPALVVIHEWWGLNDNVRTATRRLAGEGYRALAVDLYRGATAGTADSARALMKQATSRPEQMMRNLNDAHDYLRTEAQAPRVAVLGWCFGGSRTFGAVAAAPTRYDAAVAYYGSPAPMTTSVLQRLSTPILAHFGRKDQAISLESVRSFQARLDHVEAPVDVHLYDAGHAFANPSGESYVPKAAKQAWSRTTAFLARHLYL
ncbi:MAG: dienelactone hydrolase family protein [Salinibacter sp.]